MDEEKLDKLYSECKKELKTIGIDLEDISKYGKIYISISKRNAKRYGCCKQKEPNIKTKYIIKRGNKIIIDYYFFNKHYIEISKWVMNLDNSIIKNTIMHEIIHCFPGCNNHGKNFKKYSNYINKKLNYNIKRLGNKEEDYKLSNLKFNDEDNKFNYKIICKKCNNIFYRKRLKKNLIKNYRCGKCGGKLEIKNL